MNYNLTGKVAVITGGSKGMGFAIADLLSKEGVIIVLVARNVENLQLAAKKLKNNGAEVDFIVGDVSDIEIPELVINRTLKKYGRVDILINNASGPPLGNFLEQDESNWKSAIDTNLLSAIRFCKAVVPSMKKNSWGRIISITSTLAKEPTSNMVLSSTVRAGLSAFTKSIASELAEFNITVNNICPGGVFTDRLKDLIQQRSKKEGKNYNDLIIESQNGIPMKRFAAPEEIAQTVLFMASDGGGYITGVSLVVDGGLTKSY